MIDSQAELGGIASQYLSPEVAHRWLQLGRPSVRLTHALADQPAAVHLGGDPGLPDTVEWPSWPGRGPLTFVAAVECAKLPSAVALDMPLPGDGTLLFFYYDGQLGDGDALVVAGEPDSRPGSRVLYVPADTPVRERLH